MHRSGFKTARCNGLTCGDVAWQRLVATHLSRAGPRSGGLINMKAPDAAVLQAKPNCERGPDGNAVARREKIGYLLDLNGAGYKALGGFVETNVDDVMNLFAQFNRGTRHGRTLRHPTLRTIKHSVENSIQFLSTLVQGSSR